MTPENRQHVGRRDDSNALVLTDWKQIQVAADDEIGVARDRAGKNPIVIWIDSDRRGQCRGRDDNGACSDCLDDYLYLVFVHMMT